ncbi:hypothetical protein ACFL6G_09590 [candidate division KSB1 bacterium]
MKISGNNNPENITLELKLMMEQVLESLDKVQSDIREMKQSLFEPDKGLYARVGRNTDFRLTAIKWLWVLTTGVVLTIVRSILTYFLG